MMNQQQEDTRETEKVERSALQAYIMRLTAITLTAICKCLTL